MITWSDNYIMGIEQFDEEHKQLFKLADQILEKVKERGDDEKIRKFVIREGVIYIHNYFLRHAAQEEEYMRKIGYDRYELHKMLHDDFLKIQLVKYKKIAENDTCTEKDVYDFIGNGIGWLLQHIATEDMAIVGKGVVSKPKVESINVALLEQEMNFLFSSILNIEANAKIMNESYGGEFFGDAVYQKIVYSQEGVENTLISGIEQSLVIEVAKILYGDDVEYKMDLVLSTLEVFAENFWKTLGRRLLGESGKIETKSSSFLPGRTIPAELQKLQPTVSLLFTSDRGKFFVASNFISPL